MKNQNEAGCYSLAKLFICFLAIGLSLKINNPNYFRLIALIISTITLSSLMSFASKFVFNKFRGLNNYFKLIILMIDFFMYTIITLSPFLLYKYVQNT
jgi:hypothetical protein